MAAAPADNRPIAKLVPNSDLHAKVLTHLKNRLEFSEEKMRRFYSRWTAREKQIQAYIDLPAYEKIIEAMNKDRSAPPVAVSLTIPYTYATIATIATYLTHTFTGRRPIFQVGANSSEASTPAQYMETFLQWNADSRAMIKRFMQFFKDGEIYGVGAMKCLWEVEKKKRTVRTASGIDGEMIAMRPERVTFEGNDLENVDPFMFFPDPRVPMSEVATRGEFCFWRSFDSRHELKKGQYVGRFLWTDQIGTLPASANGLAGGQSARSLRAQGESNPGQTVDRRAGDLEFVQIDEGTVEIIPSALGLGDSSRPEKWIFTIANKTQIIRAEPFEYDHDMHPVVVVEPHTIGYGFGHLSTADYLAPLQDAASWFLNSHIHNVRSVLNNMLVVNPAMIEMKDLTNPKPGKLIRMKRSALGQDARTAVHQLDFHDVTRTHVADMENLFRMGDMLSSVNDNLRGIQDAGGRKTATEVRTSGEAGASRLASQAKLYSAQAFSPMSSMMCLNTQQMLSREYEMMVLGQGKSVMIGPEQLVGDFYFPLHDGTLPLDKVALLDIWKEILTGIATANPAQAQQAFAQYDLVKVFDYVAELGGAKNIESFKIAVAPQGADPTNALAAGNAVPVGLPL